MAPGCLDVLRGASPLLALHKVAVAGLLSRDSDGESALERLGTNLMEVLGLAAASNGHHGAETGSSVLQQGREASPALPPPMEEGTPPVSLVKRVKRQEQEREQLCRAGREE